MILGEANEKNIIVERGLQEGDLIYLIQPPEPEKFRLVGEDLISSIKLSRQ